MKSNRRYGYHRKLIWELGLYGLFGAVDQLEGVLLCSKGDNLQDDNVARFVWNFGMDKMKHIQTMLTVCLIQEGA